VKVEGTYELRSNVEHVWRLLNDATVLAECIPGCRSLEPAGKNAYTAEMSVGIGMIRGTYSGRVEIVDPKPPSSYHLKVEGEGPGGFIKGDALVELAKSADGTTITVSGEGEIGGMLARVGQRLASQASRSLMNQFFDCLGRKAKAS
jgi:carbon monoxide dehydrogenase subunit G